MPIKHSIWTVGETPVSLAPCRLPSEQTLEKMITRDPGILSREWMLIGRQEPTSHGGRIDLLAVAPDGALVLIELKRDRSPRELIAQALDYASWVEQLTAEKIAQIFQRFSNGGSLDEAFRQRFGSALDEETLNQSHQIVVVASSLDESSERIVNYLNERDIAINVLFFEVFLHNEVQLLSRAWLIDPSETQAHVATTARGPREAEPWNGEYYVSFGDPATRSWEDARKYGFISAGGGRWFSQTLNMLSAGDRIWVNIPQEGYVGVGLVTETATQARDFEVSTPEGRRPALDVLTHAEHYRERADDPDTTEYFVGVQWLDTVPAANAFHEVGFFGNQNTVCRPTTPRWRHTVDRLKSHFSRWDSPQAPAA